MERSIIPLLNIEEELNRLREKSQKLTETIYADLSPWQVVKVARHPKRPYVLDYIGALFTDFEELHGDRAPWVGSRIPPDQER